MEVHIFMCIIVIASYNIYDLVSYSMYLRCTLNRQHLSDDTSSDDRPSLAHNCFTLFLLVIVYGHGGKATHRSPRAYATRIGAIIYDDNIVA